MYEIVTTLAIATAAQAQRLRRVYRRRGEDGVSTLEMVIIALGLMAVAGVLVAAVTTAVNTRTKQIK